jgi:hypothetical protein
LYNAETWTLRKVDQKYLGISEIWCWRRTEKNSWTDHVRNAEALHKVKERYILHTAKRRKAEWIGHILRRNGLLKHYSRNDRGGGKTRKKMLAAGR